MLTHTETVNTFLTQREARGRLCRYMTGLGYKVIGTDNDILFERGHPLGKLPGTPPKAWPIRVFAHLGQGRNGTNIALRWELPPGFRVLAVWDVKYLRQEVQGAVRTLGAREVKLQGLLEAHTSVAVLNLFVYLAAGLTLLVVTVLMSIGDLSMTVWLLALLIVVTMLFSIRASVPQNGRGRTRTAL